MTLAETLLQKLVDWRPDGEGRHSVSLPLAGHGWTIGIQADRQDSLGCRMTELEANRDAPVANDAAALDVHARRVAARTTGLLEPLRLIEVDHPRQIALLRSEAPARKGDAVRYYEVKFLGLNRVTVERYEASQGAPARREAIPFVLTHEVLAKLVDDLVRD
jgi:hypothetical protein